MRFFKAIGYFFKMVFSKTFFDNVEQVNSGYVFPIASLLSFMQRDGRFIDFLKEDIDSFSDEEVGAVARNVHKGCRKVLNEYMVIDCVSKEAEESKIAVEKGFDPYKISLVGQVKGEPPFSGTLIHHGWQLVSVKMPSVNFDNKIIAPAEIEIGE